ncbi:MAG: FG-GAP repeat protein [Nitrosomonas sp.]|nr:FG-GAP repeat protein [Nitrosomonas sp.]
MIMTTINLSDLNGSNGYRVDGALPYDAVGNSVSNAGDINGDGFDDVIIGTWKSNLNGTESGSSYVVFGTASGTVAEVDLTSLDGSNGFRLDGTGQFERLGASVSTAGDVNGDGLEDIIIGARLTDRSSTSYGFSMGTGASYVVFGQSTGFNPVMDLSQLDGSNGFRLDGRSAINASGHIVSNAGDVNGDGFGDLIIGAPDPFSYTPEDNARSSGDAYVVFGKASGFSAALQLSSLTGVDGFRVEGIGGDHLGAAVSSAGDINGDGFDDVIISADGYYGDNSYVVFGNAAGFNASIDVLSLNGSNGFQLRGTQQSFNDAGDINGDGFDDLIAGNHVVFGKNSGFDAVVDVTALDGTNGFNFILPTTFFVISGAGDVNADGFDDLIVGERFQGVDVNSQAGVSYLVYGKASGFGATLDLTNFDETLGIRFEGVASNDFSGSAVSSAGDVNNDGFDDVIIGAPGADPHGEESGSSYIVLGGNSSINEPVLQGTPGDDQLIGTNLAERFEAGDGNDTLIGRGGADIFHAGAGNDYIRVGNLDFALVEGGEGDDTLGLGNKELNLDLANAAGKISGIETIFLYGSGDNTLTLTATDVINLSDSSNTLKILGNAGDRIVGLASGWEDGGINGSLHTFTSGDAILLVGLNVTTDFI